MQARRLIRTDVRKIEVEEYDPGPVPPDGILVQNDFTAISVGTATLAAFIGAGGLGEPIVTGLQLTDTTLILSGALPAASLALGVDGLLALVERGLRPRGVQESR